MLLPLLVLFLYAGSLQAMSYIEARDHARFLTDKMAYELNLNDEQYDYAYEINLDYLMSLNTASDAYGASLTYRNADLRYILHDWQYRMFVAADYFFHPIVWRSGLWHYPVYTRYDRRFFYYNAPRVYVEYRGGHHHIHHPHVSYYHNRRPSWHGGFRGEMRTPVGHRAPGHVGARPTPPAHRENGYPRDHREDRPRQPVNTPPMKRAAHRNEAGSSSQRGGQLISRPDYSKRRPAQRATEQPHSQPRPMQPKAQRPTTERRSSTRTTVQQSRGNQTQHARPSRSAQSDSQRPRR